MTKAEQYIKDNTVLINNIYQLSPFDAKEAIKIERQEMIKKACEYLKFNRECVTTEDNGIMGWIPDEFIEKFRKAMEEEL